MTDSFAKDGCYSKIYNKIFKFHRDHVHATTDSDWTNLLSQGEQFKTAFESRLLYAVISEIEREYQAKRYGEKFEAELLKLEQKFNSDVYDLISHG